jgi:hypothetical protein
MWSKFYKMAPECMSSLPTCLSDEDDDDDDYDDDDE